MHERVVRVAFKPGVAHDGHLVGCLEEPCDGQAVSAVMQAVSGPRLAIALAQQGGLSFIYGSQSAEDEAQMIREVKSYKAGFVVSDSTLTPDMTLAEVLELKEKTGHSTMPVTAVGTSVTSIALFFTILRPLLFSV